MRITEPLSRSILDALSLTMIDVLPRPELCNSGHVQIGSPDPLRWMWGFVIVVNVALTVLTCPILEFPLNSWPRPLHDVS